MIYKANMVFEESGTIQKTFPVVENNRKTSIKRTYNVCVTFEVSAPSQCVLTFIPEKGNIQIDGDGEVIKMINANVEINDVPIKRRKK